MDATLRYTLPRTLSRLIGWEAEQGDGLTETPTMTGEQRMAEAMAARAHPLPWSGTPAPPLGSPPWPQFASPTTTLVGRVHELTLLDRHLAGQGPPLLFLTGQPGIGKSRLLQEAAQRATDQGWRVLVGGCTRGDGLQPFAPLLQAFQHYLAARTGAERRLDLRGCAWLARLLPEFAADAIDPLPGWTLPPAQERRLMFDAVRRFLANVAGSSGTLLLLDDLHWAGADAFDLLASVLYQPPAAPFRVVDAARDTDMSSGHPLSLTIVDLAEAQLVASQPVRPPAPQEAQALFVQLVGERQQAGAALAARVAQRTGGVPFFLVSYARGLESQDGGEEPVPGVPWDVRQSIVRRVSALPEAARALLAATAVVGRVAQRTLLLAVLEQPEREVLAGLEGACRAGLLEEVGEDAYGFTHDVIREVVEAELGLARRRLLHRKIAEALERAPGQAPVAVLAFHFRQAGEPARAAVYLEQAGDLAEAQFAHTAAADHYRDLVACREGLGRTSDHLRACEKLARVLPLMAQFDATLAVLKQVVETYRASANATEIGRIEAVIAEIYGYKGALPHIDMGRLLHAEGAWGEATHHFEAVLASYAGMGEQVLTLVAQGHLAERDVLTGNPEAAQERLMAALDTPGQAERPVTQYILPVLAMAQYELGDLDQAATTAAETIRRARSGTCRLALVQALRVQALVLLAQGRHDEAVRSLDEGLAVARGMPYPHGEGRSLCEAGVEFVVIGGFAAVTRGVPHVTDDVDICYATEQENRSNLAAVRT